jgi:hypothetical protein
MRAKEIIPSKRTDEHQLIPTAIKTSARIRRLAAWFDQQEAKRPASHEEIARALIYQGDQQQIADKNYVQNLKKKLSNALKS